MKYFRVIGATLLIVGCQTTDRSSSTVKDDDVVTLDCPVGAERVYMTLDAMEPLPPPDQLQILVRDGDTLELTTSSRSRNVRLNICVNGATDTATLTGVSILDNWMGLPDHYPVGEYAIVQGLTDALFGDTSQLLIEVPYPSQSVPPWDLKLEIRSWPVHLSPEEEPRMVTSIARMGRRQQDQPFTLYSSWLQPIVGSLIVGDPFPDGICGFGQSPFQSNLTVEDAQLTFKSCTWQGTGETTNYKLIEIGVERNGQELIISEEEILNFEERDRAERVCLDQRACLSVRHHNWCDELKVQTPEYKLTLVTPSPFACPPTFPDSPATQERQRGMSYHWQAAGEEPIDGITDNCGHFVFCNGQRIEE